MLFIYFHVLILWQYFFFTFLWKGVNIILMLNEVVTLFAFVLPASPWTVPKVKKQYWRFFPVIYLYWLLIKKKNCSEYHQSLTALCCNCSTKVVNTVRIFSCSFVLQLLMEISYFFFPLHHIVLFFNFLRKQWIPSAFFYNLDNWNQWERVKFLYVWGKFIISANFIILPFYLRERYN